MRTYVIGRLARLKKRTSSFKKYSGGSILCYDPTTDSDLRQRNKWLWANLDEDVAGKVWKAIKSFGVQGDEEDEAYKMAIKCTEQRDRDNECAQKRREEKIKTIQ